MMSNEEVLKLVDALCTAPPETDAALWQDKLFRLLEVAVRTIDCELYAFQDERQSPVFSLGRSDAFPLTDDLAPAAAYLAAYLAGGDSRCRSSYERALESYLYTLEITVSPTVDHYGF